MIEISSINYILFIIVFVLVCVINIPKIKNTFKLLDLKVLEYFPSINFISSMLSIVIGFFLSAILTINIYNDQNQREVIKEQNQIMEYLEYIDENLRQVPDSNLMKGISVGYLHYEYFDNLKLIGDEIQNKKYFKLIGYLKQLQNLFYSVHNAHFVNPKMNPIRSDQAELINKTTNLIKIEIKAIKKSNK